MLFEPQPDSSILVIDYRWSLHDDVVFGHLRQGGGGEDYWHFYPSELCVMNVGTCRRIMMKLVELNTLISDTDAQGGER